MTLNLYIGRRLSFEGLLCTVRYVGNLDGTQGDWLGVEWDDPSRGKHHGNHHGKQIFECLSSSPTAASFIRPTRKPDQERTLLEAIKFKYGSSAVNAAGSVQEAVVISGKVAEEVGFNKIAQEQAQLAQLRIVLVDQQIVNAIATRGSSSSAILEAQRELAHTCPNITELDLGYNTIESWQDVVDICSALPNLRILKTAGLRLRTFHHSQQPSPLSQIRELHVEECLLKSDQISQLLADPSGFPNLDDLYLSGNQLESLTFSSSPSPPCIPNLNSLVLENNRFMSLEIVIEATKAFPNLRSISLQANKVARIGDTITSTQQSFPHIETVNLSSNDIVSYSFVDSLPSVLPNLTSLRITDNPLFTSNDSTQASDPRASDKSFYLTLARIPSLKILNYAKISSKDRQEGEIYYLSVTEKQIQELLATTHDNDHDLLIKEVSDRFLLYTTLTEKYGRESALQRHGPSTAGEEAADAISKPTRPPNSTPNFPAGSLGARLVSATFYIARSGHMSESEYESKSASGGSATAETTLRLPSSLAVTKLMSLLLQHATFAPLLQPLQFKLVFESTELDPVDSTAQSTTRSVMYGKNLTTDEKRTLWREWGEWDADRTIESATETVTAPTNDASATATATATATAATTTTIGASGAVGTSSPQTEGNNGQYWIKDGRRWKRREIEIPLALKRPWGDWIENEKDVRVRIEPIGARA